MADKLVIANVSGFYGDRLEAAQEMLEGGHVDVLTGDYLAELTMLILHKAREKSPDAGYAVTFLRQMEQVLGQVLDRGVKVVVNAGGLNPAGLADEVRSLAQRLGLAPRVAHIEGDDLMPRLAQLQASGHRLAHLDRGISLADAGVEPVSANAYLGAWGIVEALRRDADIVICPRVTDASLIVGPAAWRFGWAEEDWDELASAVVAGHLLECGPQVTGGNYAFFEEVADLSSPGFPLVEIENDGSFIVTKHEGTGGLVSVGTVTAQLLYEIAEPAYRNPDVVARFDTIALAEVGANRVRVSGVRGEPRPENLKVCLNYVGGYRNSVSLGLTGLEIDAKARLARDTLLTKLGGAAQFDALSIRLVRSDCERAEWNDEAIAYLNVTVKDRDPVKIGRAFSNKATEMLLASFPGIFTVTPPGPAREFGVYWPALIPASEVPQYVVCPDGERLEIEPARVRLDAPPVVVASPDLPPVPQGPTDRKPLGRLFGARSGDKGGNANVGVWARSTAAYAWLVSALTTAEFQRLVPESAALEVRRYQLPNILAINFVVVGLLAEGVASSTRVDPQAKGLGEFLRSREMELPRALLS